MKHQINGLHGRRDRTFFKKRLKKLSADDRRELVLALVNLFRTIQLRNQLFQIE
jgi:hypothetical protein